MLSDEDKIKCSELYEWATNEPTNPKDWNESAADILAEMYAQMITCSFLMDLVPRPPNSRPGYGWVIKIAYDAISRRYLGNKRRIYEACFIVRSAQYRRLIQIELATGV